MLVPWKKSYDKPRQHIKKQRHHFVTKIHILKAMVFPVVTYGCESWTRKKARAEELMLLNCGTREDHKESARRSYQSILKEISPGCSLEGPILKLKLQYIGHLMRRADSFEKTLMLRKIEDEIVGWHHRLNGHGFGWITGVDDG